MSEEEKVSTSLSVVDNRSVGEITSPASSAGVRANGDHDIDLVGSSRAIKDIFSLPYRQNESINIAIHNVEGTLLIDHIADADLEADPPSSPSKLPSTDHTSKLETAIIADESAIAIDTLEGDASESLAIVQSMIAEKPYKERKIRPRPHSLSGVPPPDEFVQSPMSSSEGRPENTREYLSTNF